jgi:hypothetical protein
MSATEIPTGRCYAVILYDWETETRHVIGEPWFYGSERDETDIILRFSGLDPAEREKKRDSTR